MEEGTKERRMQKALPEKPLYQLGAVVSVVAPPQTILHTAPARVSGRVLPESIKLGMYPPVYNVFTKEVLSLIITGKCTLKQYVTYFVFILYVYKIYIHSGLMVFV